MMGQKTIGFDIFATGQAVGEPAEITAITLSAGSDAATAVLYDGFDATGARRWTIKAGTAETSESQVFHGDLRFTRGVFVVLTGTAPVLSIAKRHSRANQVG